MKQTPLHAAHVALNAKMAEFAGYDMPIQYPAGVMAEHNGTRDSAGLFDVSHMGQITLEGPGTAEFLEKITPSAISKLKDSVAKYTVLTNEDGGIIDDLIITRISDEKFFAVINAGCKDKDIAWIKDNLPEGVTFTHLDDRALIALQGPKAENVLREVLNIDASNLNYMRMMDSGDFFISRLGYTGEDGFEISVPEAKAAETWNALLGHDAVQPVGLAARDSLRLEMGYPLYGHDIDATTSPVEADITWVMGKRRDDGFIGASRVLSELENGTTRKRVGIEVTGKGVAREHTEIFAENGQKIGELTSGGFSPTLNKAIGQGYIESSFAKAGTKLILKVRGRDIEAVVTDMPFVSAKTKTAQKKRLKTERNHR